MSQPSRTEDLRIFVHIIREGSLSAAARVLHMSPNTVSRSLMRLEEELERPLCIRTTRSLTPTQEGLTVYASAVRILEELSLLEAELVPDQDVVTGSVSVSLPPGMASADFMGMLGAFLESRPGLYVKLFVTDDRTPRAVHDVVVYAGTPPESELVAKRLGQLQWKLCATAEYLERHGRPEHPLDLTSHECLLFSGERPQQEWVLQRDGESVSVPVHGVLEADDTRLLHDAARAGIGIGVRPAQELGQASARGELVEVLPGWTYLHMPLYLLYPRTISTLPRVVEVRRFLERAAKLFVD